MARDDYASTVSGIADIINALSNLAKPTEEDLLNLRMGFEAQQKEMDRQTSLIDHQIIRSEKKYDTMLDEFEAAKDTYKKTTGLIYKVSDKDSTDNVNKVLDDLGGSAIESLGALSTDLKNDVIDLKGQKTELEKYQMQVDLISDFYKGYGHDFSAGDPNRWDPADFHPDELAKYIAERPELEGVDKQAFFRGVKSRGLSRMDQVSQTLNAAIDQAKTAQLTAASKKLEFDTKQENMPAAQIETDIETINTGVHSMLQSQANVLSNNFLAPARQALIEFTTSQTEQDPEGNEKLETEKNNQLMIIGSKISGLPVNSQDEDIQDHNKQLGSTLLLGNTTYINSIKGYLAGSGDLDYVGYVNALQEIQFYGEDAKRKLNDGIITTDQYLIYKNQLEEMVGTNLNDFSKNMDIIAQSADQIKNKGKLLAIAGMKDQYEVYKPSIDYEISEDYLKLEAAEEEARKYSMDTSLIDNNMIFPDKNTMLPNTSDILIEDPSSLTREQELSIQASKVRQGRPPRTKEQYAGFIKEGEPYYDPETDQWYIEQPFIDFLGGFIPIPNPEMFQDKAILRQPVAIDPIYDDSGKVVGFEPPAFSSPPSATYTRQDVIEPLMNRGEYSLTKEEFDFIIKQIEKQGK